MAGGALVLSRHEQNHRHYKSCLEKMYRGNVKVTSVDKDGLVSTITNMQPDLLIMGASFYQCCTPYRMLLLKKQFPDLNMAAISLGEYPADLGMYFILNGVTSYINMIENIEQFNKGLESIMNGKVVISEAVQRRIDKREGIALEPARQLPQKHIEVVRCICNGFQKYEIADTLYLSPRTVEAYREEIYRCLNVRNGEELFRAALRVKIVTEEELVFCHRDFKVKPFPIKKLYEV